MGLLPEELLERLTGRVLIRHMEHGIEFRIFVPYSDKPVKKKREEKPIEDLAVKAAEELFNNATKYLPPAAGEDIGGTVKRWGKDIEKIHRIDKIPYRDLFLILRWAVDHGFWYDKILSGAKFRKQFPTLWAQYHSEKEKKTVVDV